jgi:hypothetical protein
MKPNQTIFKSNLHATIFEPADSTSPTLFYTTLATIRPPDPAVFSHIGRVCCIGQEWRLAPRMVAGQAERLPPAPATPCRRTKSWPWPPTPSSCVDQEPNLLKIKTISENTMLCQKHADRYDT